MPRKLVYYNSTNLIKIHLSQNLLVLKLEDGVRTEKLLILNP
jgi:hypothetical protein